MKSIITNDLETCYICGAPREHIHHIFYGTANRKQSDKHDMIIPLCHRCHNGSNNGIHFNSALDNTIKKLAQSKFEETGTREEFRAIFGKSWL